MARLDILKGFHCGSSFSLADDVSLGRASDNTIRLPENRFRSLIMVLNAGKSTPKARVGVQHIMGSSPARNEASIAVLWLDVRPE